MELLDLCYQAPLLSTDASDTNHRGVSGGGEIADAARIFRWSLRVLWRHVSNYRTNARNLNPNAIESDPTDPQTMVFEVLYSRKRPCENLVQRLFGLSDADMKSLKMSFVDPFMKANVAKLAEAQRQEFFAGAKPMSAIKLPPANALSILFDIEPACASEIHLEAMLSVASSKLTSGGLFFGLLTDSAQLWSLAQKQVEVREVQRAKKRKQRKLQRQQERAAQGLPPDSNTDHDYDSELDDDGKNAGDIVIEKNLFTIAFPEGDVFHPFGTRFKLKVKQISSSALKNGTSVLETKVYNSPFEQACVEMNMTKSDYVIHSATLLKYARMFGFRLLDIINIRELYEDQRKSDIDLLLDTFNVPFSTHLYSKDNESKPVMQTRTPAISPNVIDLISLVACFVFIKDTE